MAETIFQYISSHWTNWLFSSLFAFLAWSSRKTAKQLQKQREEEKQKRKEEKEKVDALQEGMQALLRDRIIYLYNKYQDKGYCPIYAKENVKRMYDAYHELGGNDIATNLKNELLAMPGEPEESEG